MTRAMWGQPPGQPKEGTTGMTNMHEATTSAVHARSYLRPDELADRWSIAPKTLAKWRCEGTGPNYIKLTNGLVRYAVTDVEAFELAAGAA